MTDEELKKRLENIENKVDDIGGVNAYDVMIAIMFLVFLAKGCDF